MVSKPVANSMLVLRIIALATSAATIALMVTNNVKFNDGIETKFQDVISYRYVLAVAVIATAYGIVQLPFAIYYAVQRKRLIGDAFLPDFDFYVDKAISLFLATGIGAGFAVSLEFKRFFDDLYDAAGVGNDNPIRKANDKFLVRGIIASAVLTIATLSMAVVSIISSINRNRSKGMFNN